MGRQVDVLAVYDGQMNAGCSYGGPARLYRYNPATESFAQVVSYSSYGGFRAGMSWNGKLFLGDVSYDKIGYYDGSSFHHVANLGGSCIWDFEAYDGYLYASAWHGVLLRSNDGLSWNTKLGSAPNSRNMWAIEELNGLLYCGLDSGFSASDAQLWTYDGASTNIIWTLATTNAWEGIHTLATDGTTLYLGVGGDSTYYGSNGTGRVYSYSPVAGVVAISDTMGKGVEVLYIP
jgi:hypothetical protein